MSDQKLVFVPYSQKDRAYLDDEVVLFLVQQRLGKQIELWDDQMIGVGEDDACCFDWGRSAPVQQR